MIAQKISYGLAGLRIVLFQAPDLLVYFTQRPFRKSLSGVQLIQQGLGLLQIERVEAFGEPAVDRSEKIAGLIPLALIALEPAKFVALQPFATFNRPRQRPWQPVHL